MNKNNNNEILGSKNQIESSVNGNTNISFLHQRSIQDNYNTTKCIEYKNTLPNSVNIMSSKHVFYTKYTPLYYANYTTDNMVYCGGPFTADTIL
jgi:hypothetical protein